VTTPIARDVAKSNAEMSESFRKLTNATRQAAAVKCCMARRKLARNNLNSEERKTICKKVDNREPREMEK
jgi:hypothetical protein